MEFKHRISHISVKGLHGQFDAEIELNPGLNVIYGKNGMGKTTILHIIANALELDISRFLHLKFINIEITNYGGNRLTIKKPQPDTISLFSNNQEIRLDSEFNIENDSDFYRLRELFGQRTTYLPAFRSILERTKHDNTAFWRESEKAQTQFQEIFKREQKSLVESNSEYPSHTQREESSAIARKTLQCRTWFGSFLPIIRYPSILDVEEGLNDEWRSARINLARKESKMYEEVFNKVLRTVSLDYLPSPSKSSSDETLRSIEVLLKNQNEEEFDGGAFSIEKIMSTAKYNPSSKLQRNIQASVLNLYYEGLQEITEERKEAFLKIKNFEQSVSKFLENKKLLIGTVDQRKQFTKYVSIVSDQGHKYGLNALSSGEKQIITMLFSASRSKFHEGVFLIDEPELSLHIDWQRIVLDEITSLSPDRQIIACTHSPEVGGNHFSNAFFFSPSYYSQPTDDLFDIED